MPAPRRSSPARRTPGKARGKSPAARKTPAKSPNKVAAELIGQAVCLSETHVHESGSRPRHSLGACGVQLRTYWPGEGWYAGEVKRYVPASGKYEAAYSDGSLVLLSRTQVAQYSVPSGTPSAPSATANAAQQPRSAPSASTADAVGVYVIPEKPGFNGFFIVLLSAATACWMALSPQMFEKEELAYLVSLGLLPPSGVLGTSAHMFIANAVMCLLLSWWYKDYSWTDRLWSVVPFVYTLYFAYASKWNARCSIMAALTCLWSARLSYNFARKGGYQIGDQDYRWPWLRAKFAQFSPRFSGLLWELFNVTFIAYYQHLLLHLITLPAAIAYATCAGKAGALPLNYADYLGVVVFLSGFALETIADEQQWSFQQEKRGRSARRPALKPDYQAGFLTHGLFAYSRHPNFFGEQLVWIGFYLFSVAAKGPGAGSPAWCNASGLGVVLLVLLFQGSSRVTEVISSAKYPAYARYQKRVSMLVPLPPSK